MNELTEKALRASIARWKRIADGEVPSKGSESCALCLRFEGCELATGEKCPVYKHTGMNCCLGTPFSAFVKTAKERNREWWAFDKDSVTAALFEVAFLESLLEENTK